MAKKPPLELVTDTGSAVVEGPAAPLPARIEPTEANPEPLPQTSGRWARDADGGLRPLDAETAEQAGLAAPEALEPASE